MLSYSARGALVGLNYWYLHTILQNWIMINWERSITNDFLIIWSRLDGGTYKLSSREIPKVHLGMSHISLLICGVWSDPLWQALGSRNMSCSQEADLWLTVGTGRRAKCSLWYQTAYRFRKCSPLNPLKDTLSKKCRPRSEVVKSESTQFALITGIYKTRMKCMVVRSI